MSLATEPTAVVRDTDWHIESTRTGKPTPLPTKQQVLAVIPEDCFDRSLLKSSLYMFASLVITLGSGLAAYSFIPLSWVWLLLGSAMHSSRVPQQPVVGDRSRMRSSGVYSP